MRVVNYQFFRALLLAVAIGLLAACGGKEERKAQYLERGKSYLAEQNYDKALVEFKNVLQIDPKTAEAYLYVGKINQKKGEWPESFANYAKAIDLDPGLIEARVMLAKIYIARMNILRLTGEEESAAELLPLATEQLDAILASEPDNLDGLTLQAHMWVQDAQFEKAIQQLESVIQKDPNLASAALLLAGLYDKQDRGEEAEAVLANAVADNEDRVGLQGRLAELYRKHGKLDKAEAVLRDVVAANPDELSHRLSLATFLTQSGQIDKAETVLREAIAAAPDDVQRYALLAQLLSATQGPEAAIAEMERSVEQLPALTDLKFGLAKLYSDNGRNADAEKIYMAVISENGVELPGIKARVLLAQMLAEEGSQIDRAKRLVADVLKENPQDNIALILKGKFAANEKNYEEAIASFRAILKDQPDSAEVLRLLAAAHLENGEVGLARDTLGQAVEKQPGDVRLRAGLAQLLAQTGDNDGALEQVNEVLKLDSDNEEALSIKFELMGLLGDTAGMEAVARQMQSVMPDKEDGFIREARMRLAQGYLDEALEIVDGMLERNPDSVAALITKSDVLTMQQRYAEAIPVVEKLQLLRPDSIEGIYRKGKLLEKRGSMAEAMEQYVIALEKQPDSMDVLSAMAGIDMRAGNFDTAIQRLTSVLEQHPQHQSATDLLGRIYAAKGDYVNAEAAFRRQIETNPKSVASYSNLARILTAREDLQGAAEAYEAGLKANPDDFRLRIELATIREKQKDYESAISLYENVLDKHPDNVVSMNNLAVLLAERRSDTASLNKAEKYAERLAKTGEAVLLDTAGWVYYRRADYKTAVRLLLSAVEKEPAVPTFRYHLGMAYFHEGNKEAAREHLSKATEGEVRYEGVDEARSTLKSL